MASSRGRPLGHTRNPVPLLPRVSRIQKTVLFRLYSSPVAVHEVGVHFVEVLDEDFLEDPEVVEVASLVHVSWVAGTLHVVFPQVVFRVLRRVAVQVKRIKKEREDNNTRATA